MKKQAKNMNDNKNLHFLLIVLFLLVIITGPFLFKQTMSGELKNELIQLVGVEENLKDIENTGDPFANLELEARAVYVLDVNSGKQIYSYGEDEVLPLASLTKLMTAIIATDLIPESTVVTINKDDIRNEGDSGLLVNEKWRLSDIIDFTLTSSSNDGASAIASVAGSLGQNAYNMSQEEAKSIFVEKMNAKSVELGLLSTQFSNESGLDIDESMSGAYGTAKEIAYIMEYAIKNKFHFIEATSFNSISRTSLDEIQHTAKNTNGHTGNIPGIIASKTGFTDLAGGNLVVAIDAGLMHPIVISVLGSTINGRFEDVEKLAWAVLEHLNIEDN